MASLQAELTAENYRNEEIDFEGEYRSKSNGG